MEGLHTIPDVYWMVKIPFKTFRHFRCKTKHIDYVYNASELVILYCFTIWLRKSEREIYLHGMDINVLQVTRMRRKLENIAKRTSSATQE